MCVHDLAGDGQPHTRALDVAPILKTAVELLEDSGLLCLGMPGPWSLTRMITSSWPASAVIVIGVVGEEYFSALSIRFRITI